MKYTEQFNSGPEYLTDKCWPHTYGPKVYDELFEPLQNSVRNYLEIGSAYGGSCLLARDYFPRATIWTIDRLVPNRRIRDSERIVSLCADAYQQKVANMFAAEMDIIIDDGSKDKIYINHSSISENTPIFVKIFNNQGKTVFENQIYLGEPINIDNLNDGFYLIKIETANSFIINKFIITK